MYRGGHDSSQRHFVAGNFNYKKVQGDLEKVKEYLTSKQVNPNEIIVSQITPVTSTDVSDYGYNDTSSLDKKVMAVVSAAFAIE